MTNFQKLLEERKKQQEQAQLLAMAEFKTYVQVNFPQATATTTGLYYIVTKEGTGSKPSKFQNVSVHYTGRLSNGTVFDSSHQRNRPIEFPLGAGKVIKGWDEGIALLSKGAKATLIIPYFLAYGEQGRPPVIPPKATLIFDVELVDFR